MPIALPLGMQTLTLHTLTQPQISGLGSDAATAGDTAMLLITCRAAGEVVDLDDWCIDGHERAACQRAATMTIEEAQIACVTAINTARAQQA